VYKTFIPNFSNTPKDKVSITMPRSQTPFSLEYILLGFLAQGPIHGYDLYKKIGHFEGIALIWHVKQSQLYALLDKLEKEDLLTSKIVPGEAHLARKEFQITELGKKSFLNWLASPVQHGRDMRQEFLAKLYFAQKAGVAVSLELIDQQKTVCTGWLAGLQNNLIKTSAEEHFERMTFQYRIAQIQATLEWLEYCRGEMGAHF
jgi:DNA-binding PadR family transcriptional regulator